MTRLLMFSVAALLAMASSALGEPYWITYEGNDLPENEGWNRSWGNDDGQYPRISQMECSRWYDTCMFPL